MSKLSPLGLFIKMRLASKADPSQIALSKATSIPRTFLTSCFSGKRYFTPTRLNNIANYLELTEEQKIKMVELNEIQKNVFTIKISPDTAMEKRRMLVLLIKEFEHLDSHTTREILNRITNN